MVLQVVPERAAWQNGSRLGNQPCPIGNEPGRDRPERTQAHVNLGFRLPDNLEGDGSILDAESSRFQLVKGLRVTPNLLVNQEATVG